jgi:hypothetical protein
MSRRRATDDTPSLPPLSGSIGRLLRAPGRDLAVEVVWQSGGELTLELVGPHEKLTFPALEELVLECSSSRGMVRLGGELSPVEATGGRLRFRVHDVIEVEQRRRFVRVRVSRPVRIARASDGHVSHTFALDLSGGGLLLAGPDKLETGEQIEFRLRLDAGSEPIEGMARVVRAAGSAHPALTFDSISAVDRERLIHFIFDRERSARALARDTEPQPDGDANEPGSGS